MNFTVKSPTKAPTEAEQKRATKTQEVEDTSSTTTKRNSTATPHPLIPIGNNL